MRESDLERALAFQLKVVKAPRAEREVKFHPTRDWRFDFAWPERMLAAEVEGGNWVRGRHVRPATFEADCEKYNAAALLGWRVLRFTGDMVEDGRAVEMLEQALYRFAPSSS